MADAKMVTLFEGAAGEKKQAERVIFLPNESCTSLVKRWLKKTDVNGRNQIHS